MFVCGLEFTPLIWSTPCLLQLSHLRLGTLPVPPQNSTECVHILAIANIPTKNSFKSVY